MMYLYSYVKAAFAFDNVLVQLEEDQGKKEEEFDSFCAPIFVSSKSLVSLVMQQI